MSTLVAIGVAIVCLMLLGRAIGSARAGSWAGPQTPAMRTRAASPRSAPRGRGKAVLRTAGTAAGSVGSAVLHPSNGGIRAQAKADAHRLWQEALATNWLEERRHERANGTAPATGTATGGGTGTATAARPTIRQRLRLAPPIPPQPQATGGSPNGNVPQPATPTGTRPANGNGGPSARPVPPPPPAPPPTSGTNGGTNMAAGTSTASAEKLIEGINEIHAHAAMGGIKTGKQEGIKASHEGLIRFGAMLVMLARQMSEPGMNYGPEITEPLAQAGQHCQAAAMSVSEADAALSTLINMTVGDLATSARQAPHHAELSETGAR